MFGKVNEEIIKVITRRSLVVVEDIKTNWEVFDNSKETKLTIDTDVVVLGVLGYMIKLVKGRKFWNQWMLAYWEDIGWTENDMRYIVTNADVFSNTLLKNIRIAVITPSKREILFKTLGQQMVGGLSLDWTEHNDQIMTIVIGDFYMFLISDTCR